MGNQPKLNFTRKPNLRSQNSSPQTSGCTCQWGYLCFSSMVQTTINGNATFSSKCGQDWWTGFCLFYPNSVSLCPPGFSFSLPFLDVISIYLALRLMKTFLCYRLLIAEWLTTLFKAQQLWDWLGCYCLIKLNKLDLIQEFFAAVGGGKQFVTLGVENIFGQYLLSFERQKQCNIYVYMYYTYLY